VPTASSPSDAVGRAVHVHVGRRQESAGLNELDDRAMAALDAANEIELDQRLDEMWELVRSEGERLPDEELAASDAVIPPTHTDGSYVG